MSKMLALLGLGLTLPTAVIAHHGWGSYEAANPVTVAGPIETLSPQ